MNHYRLGLPAWAFPAWNNRYFTNKPSALHSYARVFNTVEGNTTFYHVPDAGTVAKWYSSVVDSDFRFCFKLPRTVTHTSRPDFGDLHQFFKNISPLKEHLGPFLLQFPSTTGPQQLGMMEQIIERLPKQYRYTLEVRHPAFFNQQELLHPLLESYKLGLVVMDTRPIFHGNHNHPEVLTAVHEKPDVPVWKHVFNQLLFVRLLLHPDIVSNGQYIDQWVKRISTALDHGCECYMMIHCPNNFHCPALALDFHDRLRTVQQSLAPLTPWPLPQQHSLL